MSTVSDRMGKWAASIEIVRALVAARQALEEAGASTKALDTMIENARWEFIATLPKKVQDELMDG